MTFNVLEKKLKPFEDPVSHPLGKWLYLHFPPRPLTSKKMYDHYYKAINILIKELETENFPKTVQSVIQEHIKSVMTFLEDYEKQEFPLKSTDAEEVLRFLMEQNELSQYDLASDLGGQPVVSDILRGKRKLTREHIERLSKRFGISPATFFVAKS